MGKQMISFDLLAFIVLVFFLSSFAGVAEAQNPAVIRITQKSGVVTTPYYPASVAPNSKYRWMISVPDAISITIRFEDFDVQDLTSSSCARNYIVFYDARQNSPSRICDLTYAKTFSETGKTRFCNRKLPYQAIVLQSDLVIMEYCAPPRPGRGFRLFFQEDMADVIQNVPVATTPVTRPGGGSAILPAGIQCSMDSSSLNYCGCGRSAIPAVATRIVGGKEAKPHTWPWIVHVRRNYNGQPYPVCGGTLISEWYVVTAAHCVDTSSGAADPALYSIKVGEHSRIVKEASEEDYNVELIVQHPNYQRWDNDNDLALLKLSRKVTLKNEVNVVCLPLAGSEPAAGSQATVVGWGETVTQDVLKMIRSDFNVTTSSVVSNWTRTPDLSHHGPVVQKIITGEQRGTGGTRASAMVLMEVSIPMIARNVCQGSDYYGYQITSNMMCAGLAYGTMDACKGDSGGPLMAKSNDRWTLIGVVSWGDGCAVAKRPGVYVQVANYVNWIKSNTGIS